MSPAEFGQLVRAWERREARTDRRFALIACVLANIHRGSDADPFDLRDFMPLNEKERADLEAERLRASHQRLSKHMAGARAE